jgi:hypothetical protein
MTQPDYFVKNRNILGGAIRIIEMENGDHGYVGLFAERWLFDGARLYMDGNVQLYPRGDDPIFFELPVRRRDDKLYCDCDVRLFWNPLQPDWRIPTWWRRVWIEVDGIVAAMEKCEDGSLRETLQAVLAANTPKEVAL